MLNNLIAWIREWWTRRKEFTRPARLAQAERDRSLAAVTGLETGVILCPWHMGREPTCTFNNKTLGFRCSSCHRAGSMATLIRRLKEPHAYEREIQ
jgi:hypothetical protein